MWFWISFQLFSKPMQEFQQFILLPMVLLIRYLLETIPNNILSTFSFLWQWFLLFHIYTQYYFCIVYNFYYTLLKTVTLSIYVSLKVITKFLQISPGGFIIIDWDMSCFWYLQLKKADCALQRLYRLGSTIFPKFSENCRNILTHKTTYISYNLKFIFFLIKPL